MKHPDAAPCPPTTPVDVMLRRRHLLGGAATAGLLTLSACGGGGGDPTPAPPAPVPAPTPAPVPPAPPAPTPQASPGIELLAGGLGGAGELEGPGTDTRVTAPTLLTAAPDGTVYFVDTARIGRITPSGSLEFIASRYQPGFELSAASLVTDGSGLLHASAPYMIHRYASPGGFVAVAGRQETTSVGFEDGRGAAARMINPTGLVRDSQGTLYFVDQANRAVRRLASDGTVTTLAGQPDNTRSVDGPGAAAGFSNPRGMACLANDSLVVLDGNTLRRVSLQGQVTTLATGLPEGLGTLSGDQLGRATLVPDGTTGVYALLGHSVVRLGLDGALTTIAGVRDTAGSQDAATGSQARFDSPGGLALLNDGDLLVADTKNSVIRRVKPSTGRTAIHAGAAPQPGRVDGVGHDARFADMGASAADAAGNIYVIDVARKNLRRITPEGVVTTLFQDFPSEGGLAIDTAGNFYGVRNRAIVRIAPGGAQSVHAGRPGELGSDDGPGAQARFARPMGMAFDREGNLFVGDAPDIVPLGFFDGTFRYSHGDTIRKITPAGVVSTFSGEAGRTYNYIPWMNPPVAQFREPRELATDAAGRVYVRDRDRLLRIAASGGPAGPLVPPAELAPSLDVAVAALAVTPDAEVYFVRETREETPYSATKSQVTLYKLDAAGAIRTIAGEARNYRRGVRLGRLPGALNSVQGIVVAQGMVHVLSENAALRIKEV